PLVLAIVACELAGCGSQLAEVEGTVTLDGQKVVGGRDVRGTVLFSPNQPGLPSGSGALDESGTYTAYVGATEGLPPGSYGVAVTVTKIVPPSAPGGTPSGRLLSPPEYSDPRNSGLHADVKAGRNRFDFALSSQRKP